MIPKVFAEEVRLVDLCPPPLGVGFSDLLGEEDKDDEDPESLEGHQDGVDVGQRQQCLHLHYQHSHYPGQPHDHHQRHCCSQPVPKVVTHTVLASLVIRRISPI